MKNILFISYYYPPVNNAGTQRIEKFVQYLPEFGFNPLVLTTSYFIRKIKRARSFFIYQKDRILKEQNGEALIFYAPDLRNLFIMGRQELGENNEISGYSHSKVKNNPLSYLKRFIKTYLIFPDSKITWFIGAFFSALWLIRKYQIEYIVTSFPPTSSHLLGLILKKVTYVKWIADFRDGWCFDPLDPVLRHSPTRLFLEKKLESKVAASCDQILVTSPKVGQYFNTYKSKVHLITNGFDSADFNAAKQNLAQYQDLEKYFVIVHTGALHLSHPGNTPYYFFQALKQCLEEHPTMLAKIKVFFLGNLTREEMNLPKAMGLENVVKMLGLRAHLESIQYRLVAQVLLLIDRPIQSISSYIHGKVFEHLASRKPILALLPKQSAARDFLASLRVGEIIEPERIDEIKQKIWQLFCEWEKGGIVRYELTSEELARFERKNLTKQLAEIMG